MHITYSISLWNFSHYAMRASLERVIADIRKTGYGIELWGSCWNEPDLYDEIGRARLKPALEGMTVSLHTVMRGAGNFALHQQQIDAAAELDAGVIVLHPNDVLLPDRPRDWDVVRRAVDYAGERGVKLALENGKFDDLAEAFENVPGLFCCIDVGHIYLDGGTMRQFLDAFSDRLIHLHLQELCPPQYLTLPGHMKDHYCCGEGSIPREDWELLGETLRRIDFNGIAVFEIHPESPLELAMKARRFINDVFEV